MNADADADLDLLGVLVIRRDRLIEAAQVLRRDGFASIAPQLDSAGGPARFAGPRRSEVFSVTDRPRGFRYRRGRPSRRPDRERSTR